MRCCSGRCTTVAAANPDPVRAKITAMLFNFLRTCGLALLLFCALPLVAQQDDKLKFIDNTYVDYIKTVRLHINGFPHSYPLIELGGNAVLRLSFDDLSDEVRRYSYKFIHCDQDWKPSGLSPLEFNSGYSIDYLDEFDFSLRTLTEYVHYDLTFPNSNMKIEASGNYLLVVYDEEEEAVPVITRRFMVHENVVSMTGRVMQAANVSKIHTHQEIDLAANITQLNVKAPMREISLTVLQNNRWDNAIIGIEPNLLKPGIVRFDYQGKVSFQGGNEFRNLDIRSVQAPRSQMVSITNEGDYYAMMMQAENTRDNDTYIGYFDLNGDFVNYRFDRAVFQLADEELQATYGRLDDDFNGEYVEVTFVLDTKAPFDRDIYLFGGFTEWQLKKPFKMVWNENINVYLGRAMIKQGFYNYYFVTEKKPEKGEASQDRINFEGLEGSFDETENDYLTLVYWRPMGGRYDRLVGARVLNTNVD